MRKKGFCRVDFTIPKALKEEMDKVIPLGQRSHWVSSLIEEKIRKLKLEKALNDLGGYIDLDIDDLEERIREIRRHQRRIDLMSQDG